MTNLEAAHRGYEYQDLLVACRFADLLLGTAVETRVDEKLVDGDLFDDLTTHFSDGSRERVQIKHTSSDERPLTAAVFTNDSRLLRLDRVLASMLADRDGPGAGVSQQIFRVVLRDTLPVDPCLTSVLRHASSDPGPFLPAMQTVRLAFDADALWLQMEMRSAGEPVTGDGRFSFLADAALPLSYPDLVWACSRLVIEVEAPAASRDLTAPGPAEALLLKRVREEVGAGVFPNQHRDPVDVAAAMIGAAIHARAGEHVVTRELIVSRARLRTDFGAVAVAKPVDAGVEVSRDAAVQQITSSAAKLAESGGTVLVVGPPGQGKTWLCHQAIEELSNRGWLIAEHYCYLNDADSDRSERVLAEKVFGSLVARLADGDPTTVEGQLPALAADEDKLVHCIAHSAQSEPDRPVALVIDGIDHITRVQAGQSGGPDPSLGLAERLAALELPAGCVLIVLSQPGAHLRPLEEAGATTVHVEGLDRAEIRALAEKLGLLPPRRSAHPPAETPLIGDEDEAEDFLDALTDRSEGNALYATYLCSEASNPNAALLGPAAAVRGLPAYAGTLEHYYSHLYSTLGSDGGWVADVICWIDFAVTRSELRDIRPDAAHRVDRALKVLAPVLVERAAQGGVRVYHESFARYLRGSIQSDPDAKAALIGRITSWLEQKGMFNDTRAFRSLLPLLAEAGRYDDAAAHIDMEFVVRSAASGFPASAIASNLAMAIRCAARLGKWPLFARCVELSRAAERFGTGLPEAGLLGYSDVPIALLGPAVAAERLLCEDRTAMAARDGLQMCAAVDESGAVAPWSQYMTGYIRESEHDNTVYDPQSDQAIGLAWLRGRLRLSADSPSAETEPDDNDGHSGSEPGGWQLSGGENDNLDLYAPIDWARVAAWVEQQKLPEFKVVEAIADTRGAHEIPLLISELDNPGAMCLALAMLLADEHVEHSEVGSARQWAARAVVFGIPPGVLHTVASIDAGLLAKIDLPSADCPDGLLDLTRAVQQPRNTRDSEGLKVWLDSCTVAAHQDPLSLNTAEVLIAGEGWYKCWLRFAVGLARAEAASPDLQARLASESLGCLTDDLRPFAGNPRACDLFSIQPAIADTIWRATRLVGDDQWAETLRLLNQVSDSITTTIHGEMGGPLPADLVTAIAVDGARQGRKAVAAELLAIQTGEGSAGRYYADLAEFELLGARLALASDDREGAWQHWHQACRMLASYGFRKDLTVFELLNPLSNLIAADRRRGRHRVSTAQPLCERIPSHTDGSETHYAPTQWWQLLSLADPEALAHLAAPGLLRRCNHPNRLLHGALEALWRSWAEHADPVLAGALRLTLDTPLESKDAQALSRLVPHPVPGHAAADLATWLLARADERPISYGASNSREILEIDDQKVADLNSIAATTSLPNIVELRRELDDRAEQAEPEMPRSDPAAPGEEDSNDPLSSLPPGPAGLARAIRCWRKRPYKIGHPFWSAARFADVIEARLLELLDNGRDHDAERALRSLGDACEFRDGTELLQEVAERLEHRGRTRLAANAYTLAWTRSRGRGGWVNFGGETDLQSLRCATGLDPAVALEIVAEETERVIASGRYGSYGIAQALIYAFCDGALAVPDTHTADVAFAIWDEAFAVIDYRAPHVHESDNPEDPYAPASDDSEGEVSQGELDTAFALATLGSLAHPSREKKRRSLLAAELLISERPAAAIPVIGIALEALSDPATTAWLLHLIEQHGGEHAPLTAEGKQALAKLATGPHLAVRAVARRLLGGEAPPMPPPDPADPALLRQTDGALWTPPGADQASTGEPPIVNQLVQDVAGCRLSYAEPLLPGLTEAVRSRVAAAMETDDFRRVHEAQISAYADQIAEHMPDAFLIWTQTVEEALQLAAAGSRAALIAAGSAVSDPAEWEDDLALRLLDDPSLSLAVEARRTPRPQIPVPLPLASPIWTDASTNTATEGDSEPYELLADQDGLLAATLQIHQSGAAELIEQGPYQSWRIIASAEQRTIPHPDWSQHGRFVSNRYRAIELRGSNAIEGLDLPPAAPIGDIRVWGAELEWTSEDQLPNQTTRLFGVDLEAAAAGDGVYTLGVHPILLAPTPGLGAFLGLKPGEPFTLADNHGCGLALITWRAAYETSDYHLPNPGLVGSAVLARPDLFERLQHTATNRLVLRDFAALSTSD